MIFTARLVSLKWKRISCQKAQSVRHKQWKQVLDPAETELSIARQRRLLGTQRSFSYYKAEPIKAWITHILPISHCDSRLRYTESIARIREIVICNRLAQITSTEPAQIKRKCQGWSECPSDVCKVKCQFSNLRIVWGRKQKSPEHPVIAITREQAPGVRYLVRAPG